MLVDNRGRINSVDLSILSDTGKNASHPRLPSSIKRVLVLTLVLTRSQRCHVIGSHVTSIGPFFIIRNSTEPPSQANTGADTTGSISGDQYPSLESRKQRSLVIEDYYRVSVEPPDARAAAPVSFVLDDALGGDSRRGLHQVDSPAPGHDSSFMSEDGPAQWLASPQTGLDHTENLSMELAEDTSESDGEHDKNRM